MQKIAIIGGGAAGLMCAATLVEKQHPCEIYLFERNKYLGAKVIISGGGRCNVTTGIKGQGELLSKYLRGKDFLQHALSRFSPQDIYKWFESHGVALKTEKDLRVFPVSDDGHDIVNVFEKLFTKNNAVHIQTDESVKEITKSDVFHITTNKDTYECDQLVITTGGNAYRHTGSQGDGYHFATALGHTITELGPSLSSFEVREPWSKSLQGLSLPQATITFRDNHRDVFAYTGGLLFTHFGITGPAVFAVSSYLAFHEIAPESDVKIFMKPCAETDFDFWDQKFGEDFARDGKKQLKTVLMDYVPERLASVIATYVDINHTQKVAEIGKKQRHALARVFSDGLQMTVTARRKGDEFVTAGGVDTHEVNARTGESKICSGLYFAGEVLNVDGLTGGFNLSSSWALGRLVAESIVDEN